MSDRPKFNPDEIKNAKTYPGMFGTTMVRYDTPITPRENMKLAYERKLPYWIPGPFGETNLIRPDCQPDIASRSQDQGLDMFGIAWTYVPAVHGSIVKPGAPTVKDINHWEDYVKDVDVRSWDWAGCAERMKEKLDPTRMIMGNITCGFFERLISFLDFDKAAMALVDEDQQEGVHRLFNRLCEIYDEIIDCLQIYFNVEVINFHDDWGSQRAPFFSSNTVREMILPYISRTVESMHKRGMYFDFHSCGFVEPLVPLMIEAKMDSWGGQELNDKRKLKKLYGNQLLWSIPSDPVPDNATDDELYALAKKYMEEVAPDGGVVFGGMGRNQKYNEYLYQISREMYCK